MDQISPPRSRVHSYRNGGGKEARYRPSRARQFAWALLIAIRPVTRLAWYAAERHTLRRHAYLPIETPHGLVCVVATAHTGADVELRGGVRLTTGDPLLELHFNSTTLVNLLGGNGGNGNGFIRAGLEDLSAIARHLRDTNFSYRAVYCRTILWDMLNRVHAYIPERQRTLYDRLEQLFQEMAIMIFRKKKGVFPYLHSHYHRLSLAWYTAEEFARFE